MKIDLRSLHSLSLFIFITAIAFLFLLSDIGVFGTGVIPKVISYTFIEFAIASTAIIAILALSNNNIFYPMVQREYDVKRTIIFIALLSILCCIVSSFSANFFNCTPMIVFFICIYCGPIVGIPVALISALFITIKHCVIDGSGTITMGVVMLTFALCPAVVSKERVPNRIQTLKAIVVATVISFVIMLFYFTVTIAVDLNEHIFYYLLSLVALFVSLAFFVLLLNIVRDIIDRFSETVKNRKELSLAHDIQQSYLIKEFPTSRSIDFFAFMEPALMVGGDFYDIYRINHNLTLAVIADVSDKGLPASMLMMRAMGMIRSASSVSNDPGTILSILNKQLCESNPTGQFITVFVGVYDSDTGLFAYSNAGHPPPYIRHSNGRFEKLQTPKGLIIGAFESAKYMTNVITLNHNDAIFCYTDGVNEAFDPHNRMFGQESLLNTLNSIDPNKDAHGIVDDVYGSVKAFTKGYEASDDITMLSFIVHRDWYRHMDFDAKVENLDSVNGFIRSVLTEVGCSEKKILKMEIISEELFINICDHAYEGKGGDVTVYCSYYDNEIKMTFVDKATTFNPVLRDDLVIDDDVNNWRIGGFGIHMVKELATHISYKRFSGLNILTVWSNMDDS